MREQGQRRGSEAFEAHFGSRPEHLVRAPGRVNLIGEHTDYNAGLVLPCAIDRDTRAWAAPRSDRRVRARSREQPTAIEFALDSPVRSADWGDYVRGAAVALAARGHALSGADLWFESEVPPGAGLSSSAALSVAAVLALAACSGVALSAREAAEVAHFGEADFVGVGCGILDHFASALGRSGHALRIDCRDRSVEPVPLGGRFELLLAHSGVTRRLVAGGYGDRVAECAAVLAAARSAGLAPAAARSLRDLGGVPIAALERALPPLLFRRVRHVLTENERVDAFCAAVRAGDLAAAGRVLRAGMQSLRDDYEVSVPELDRLCALGDAHPGCHGSRLTGAGFGGCTLHLVEPAAAGEVAARLRRGFAESFGREPVLYRAHPAAGASQRAL